jgi:hypothetical protein
MRIIEANEKTLCREINCQRQFIEATEKTLVARYPAMRSGTLHPVIRYVGETRLDVFDEIANGEGDGLIREDHCFYKAAEGEQENGEVKEQRNVKINGVYVQEEAAYGNRIGLLGTQKEIKRFFNARQDIGNFCPVGIAYVFEPVSGIISGRDLFRIVFPVTLHVGETGEMRIGPDKIGIEGRVEDGPSVIGLYFHDIMCGKIPVRLHLGDAYGQVIGFQDAGEYFGITSAGALGGHEIDRGRSEKVRLSADHGSAAEHRCAVTHNKMTGLHRFYNEGVLVIVAVEDAVDIVLYGNKEGLLVGRFNMKIKKGGQEKAIQEHEEI